MSMIDTQNAKQIRDPMDVLITMELPDEGVTLTYSGYSTTAKVADGELGETSWPMRQIADLQGEGFPLDGSHVLYNPSTPASTEYGKIGVRSNTGEAVTITVTANRSVASLTIFATGAASVEYNGQTAAIVGGSVVIPVGATSVTLTFNPVSQTERIEVSDIVAGTTFRITNESLIKAVVSLRSDLSPFGQTLPESEINIDVYQDVDISEVVATIPEDTPITYQAGYPGDMSPVRKFYVSGQVTWADNVLHIQGVDAVHFLDRVTVNAPVTERTSRYIHNLPLNLLYRAGIAYNAALYGAEWTTYADHSRWVVRNGVTARDYLSFCQNAFNLTDEQGYLVDGTGRLYAPLKFAYIDAGIPTIRTRLPGGARKTIDESDCAAVNRDRHVPVTRIDYTHDIVLTGDPLSLDYQTEEPPKVGTAKMMKGIGTSLNFDRMAYDWEIGLNLGYGNTGVGELFNKYAGGGWPSLLISGALAIVPASEGGAYETSYADLPNASRPAYAGRKVVIGSIPQEHYTDDGESGNYKLFSAFVAWSQPYESSWTFGNKGVIGTADTLWNHLIAAGIIDSAATTLDLDIFGLAIETSPMAGSVQVPGSGQIQTAPELPIMGELYADDSASITDIKIFPEKALAAPMYRSNKTISFTWKGDPRIQPRDVFTFRELDGTENQWTFENITLTHEKGGTLAEITARKGVI